MSLACTGNISRKPYSAPSMNLQVGSTHAKFLAIGSEGLPKVYKLYRVFSGFHGASRKQAQNKSQLPLFGCESLYVVPRCKLDFRQRPGCSDGFIPSMLIS